MGARSWSFGIGLMVAVGMIVGRSEGAAEVTAAPSVPKAVVEASTCQSRSDCGSPVKGGLQITFTGWSCTTGFVARDTETWHARRAHGRSLPGGQRAVGALVAPWGGDRAGVGRGLPGRLERRRRCDRGCRTGSGQRGLRLEQHRHSERDWLGVERLPDGRVKGLPLGRNIGLGLRNDRRGRCRCDDRWTAHSPHVVDRLSVGRGRQRLPGARRRWEGGRHRDRDHANAIPVLDRRLDRHRATRSSLRYAGLRLIGCPRTSGSTPFAARPAEVGGTSKPPSGDSVDSPGR